MAEVVVPVLKRLWAKHEPGKRFYYQRGSVWTSQPWGRPTWSRLNHYGQWLRDQGFDQQYQIYFRGGVLYDIRNTWDLDINLLGTVSNQQLESDMNRMLQAALEQRLLIDIKWVPELFQPITPDQVYEPIRPLLARETAPVYKQSGDVFDYQDKRRNLDVKVIGQYLIEYVNVYEHKNHFINRLRAKPDLRQSMSFEEFRQLNEQEFLAITDQNK